MKKLSSRKFCHNLLSVTYWVSLVGISFSWDYAVGHYWFLVTFLYSINCLFVFCCVRTTDCILCGCSDGWKLEKSRKGRAKLWDAAKEHSRSCQSYIAHLVHGCCFLLLHLIGQLLCNDRLVICLLVGLKIGGHSRVGYIYISSVLSCVIGDVRGQCHELRYFMLMCYMGSIKDNC